MLHKLKKLFFIVVELKKLKGKGCIVNLKTVKSGILSNNIGEKVAFYGVSEISKGVKVGDYTAISPGNKVFSGDIGRFCSIGHDCIIGPHEHPLETVLTHALIYYKQYKFFNENNGNYIEHKQKQSPIIEDNVWIGARSIILRGCTIGEGAVIAANSVVTKNVEPYSIVAGVPARHIRYRDVGCFLETKKLKTMKTKDILADIRKGSLL